MWKNINWVKVFIGAIVLISLAGCQFWSDDEVLPPLNSEEEIELKVLIDVEGEEVRDYAVAFKTMWPNLNVKYITMQEIFKRPGVNVDEELEKLLEREQPDVIKFESLQVFKKWVDENKLVPLDPIIKATNFNLDGIHPHVLEAFTEWGNGQLYGLTPTFSSSALFYNKDLFDEYGVDYPTDQMSWEEVLNLAARFPTDGEGESRIYGFDLQWARSTTFDFIKLMGETNQLVLWDETEQTLTLNTPEWKRVFETAIRSYEAGYVHNPKMDAGKPGAVYHLNDLVKDSPFLTGRAAMTVGDPFVFDLLRVAKNELGDAAISNWEFVTAPVHPDYRDESPWMKAELYGIHANTPHLRAAWEYVSLVNSEEVARKYKISGSSLPVRTDFIKDYQGRDLEPFYRLRPGKTYLPPLPHLFHLTLADIASEEVNAVLNGEKTLDEALAEIEQRGNAELARILVENRL